MEMKQCLTKIKEFENNIKNHNHIVYYIESSYCGTLKLYRWIETGYVWKYEINHSCCGFSVGVRLEFEDRTYSLEELYATKEEAQKALDNIERIGE